MSQVRPDASMDPPTSLTGGSGTGSTRAGATLAAAFAAPFVASLANAIPGSLNGVYQTYFHAKGSQLTWITAAFLIPVVVFELTFGALGDIYGRKRLMYLGSVLLIAGGIISALDGLGAGVL
jgi:MFS family permease